MATRPALTIDELSRDGPYTAEADAWVAGDTCNICGYAMLTHWIRAPGFHDPVCILCAATQPIGAP